MELKGKRAFVTGASRGMGLAITEALAAEGAKLFITARDSKALEGIKADLSAIGTIIDFISADLAIPDQVERAFKRGVDFLDGIDILINNAGMNIKSPVVDLLPPDWDTIQAVNLRAPYLLSRLAARHMISQRSGHIINIGSGASQTPIAGHAAYCAAKHGLLGFSESLALELREYGIKVSILMPGSTATHFGGTSPDEKASAKPGILRPEDIADSVLYLLKQSPQAWTSTMNLRPLNPNKI
jgi:3-oxoacyl-[acyl-carrier protein] reductase